MFVLDGVLVGAGVFRYDLRTWTVVAAAVSTVGSLIAVVLNGGLLGLWIALEAVNARPARVAARAAAPPDWAVTDDTVPT